MPEARKPETLDDVLLATGDAEPGPLQPPAATGDQFALASPHGEMESRGRPKGGAASGPVAPTAIEAFLTEQRG